MRKVITVGQYLIARSLKFVARPFHMTNQRSRRSSDTIGLFSFCSLAGNQVFSILSFDLQVPAGKYLMELVAIDWFKDTKRMDHVARRKGSAAQVRKPVMDSWLLNGTFLSQSTFSVTGMQTWNSRIPLSRRTISSTKTFLSNKIPLLHMDLD